MLSAPTTSTLVKKRALRDRRMVLVDVENLAGGAIVTRDMADWAQRVVDAAIVADNDDQVVIGTSHLGLFNVRSTWPSARVRVRSGVNGADLELLDVMTSEQLATRFDEVVLVSGDGIFTDAVTDLRQAGVRVVVASWSHGLAARLRLAASETRLLDGWHGLDLSTAVA